MKTLLALLTTCLALTLAACGGDDDEDSGSSSTGTTTTEQTDTGGEPADKAAKTVAVDIPSISFDPANVTVKAGTTVKWTNSDDIPHTVTKTDGPGADFDSGNLEAGGAEFAHTFEEKGEFDYVCEIHPGQEGSVTVE